MSKKETALAEVPKQELQAPTPEQEIALASRVATNLDKIIQNKKLYKTINGKKHVYVEGWTAVAALRGVTPIEVSNEPREDGSFVAVVKLVNAEGREIGRASAECGGPEEEIWQKRVPNARHSMAATRATSKACRLCFSWIMVLSGYSGTPAEEMESVGGSQNTSSSGKKGANRASKGGGGASTPPKGSEGSKSTENWTGEKECFLPKFRGTPWAEVPGWYLTWVVENMDPKKGPAHKMAAMEMGRRAKLEAEGDVVDAEVVREPGEDDEPLPFDGDDGELEERFR